jgi:hypothetical protein
LRNLLTDAKRDRAARISGYVAISLVDELVILYLLRGELANASVRDARGTRAIAIADAVDRVPEEPEYGEICFHEADLEQLSCMFAAQATPPEPWPEGMAPQDPAALFPYLMSITFDGMLEIIANEYVNYLVFKNGSVKRAFLAASHHGTVVDRVAKLFAREGRVGELCVARWGVPQALPQQAPPALLQAYRDLSTALVNKLVEQGRDTAPAIADADPAHVSVVDPVMRVTLAGQMSRRAVLIIFVSSGLVAAGCAQAGSDHAASAGRARQPLPEVPQAPPNAKIVTAAGDICTATPQSCSPTAHLVRSLHPDVALTLGDNQYDAGTLAEYLQSYDHAWGRFKAITDPVAGNHEWKTPNAQGFLDYFGRIGYWYSFKVGGWRLYALDGTCSADGGCGVGDPQYEWLKQKLAARTDRCILAYWHQPRFSSGTTHGSATNVAPLWDLLYDAGADLVLNGHEHNYERFAPQDPAGGPMPNGIVEIVAGTGGNGDGSYPFGTPIANSEVRLNGLGVVELRLWPHGWVERFLRPSGAVVDRSSGTC